MLKVTLLAFIGIFAFIGTANAAQHSYDLYAGQHAYIGTVDIDVHAHPDSPKLGYEVTANVNITADNYCVAEVHFYADTKVPKSAPGRFTVKSGNLGCVPHWDGVAYTEVFDPNVAAHADVWVFPYPITGSVDYRVTTTNPDAYFWGEILSQGELLNGWCYDLGSYITPGRAYEECELINTLDPNAPVDKPENLDIANWILNHKELYRSDAYENATALELQKAVWMAIDNADRAASRPEVVKAIFDHAMANGEGYNPITDGGTILALLVDCGDNVQRTVIEVLIEGVHGETAWAQMSEEFKQGWGSYEQISSD